MDVWEIETKIPLYSEELICSARMYLTIRDSSWATASDETIIAKLDEMGFTDQLIAEFDKALCKALEPAPPSMYNNFSEKHFRPIDWNAIGRKVGKLYLDSKRRPMSDVTTK